MAGRGDHVQAVALAETLVTALNVTNVTFYNAACVFSLASVTAKGDDVLANRYAARAVELLRRSFIRGYTNIAHMLRDPDLDPLRLRADYIDLLWDLADTRNR